MLAITLLFSSCTVFSLENINDDSRTIKYKLLTGEKKKHFKLVKVAINYESTDKVIIAFSDADVKNDKLFYEKEIPAGTYIVTIEAKKHAGSFLINWKDTSMLLEGSEPNGSTRG